MFYVFCVPTFYTSSTTSNIPNPSYSFKLEIRLLYFWDYLRYQEKKTFSVSRLKENGQTFILYGQIIKHLRKIIERNYIISLPSMSPITWMWHTSTHLVYDSLFIFNTNLIPSLKCEICRRQAVQICVLQSLGSLPSSFVNIFFGWNPPRYNVPNGFPMVPQKSQIWVEVPNCLI